MADKPDIDELAQTYLELWQRQMSGAMNDPEVSKWITQTTQSGLEKSQEIGKAWGDAFSAALDNQGVAQTTDFAQHGASSKAEKDGQSENVKDRENRTAGAKASAAASSSDDRRIDELERRVAALEEQLASLEGRPARPRGRPRKKS